MPEQQHKLDQLMLIDLENAKQPETYHKAGKLLTELGLLDEKDNKNVKKIVDTYKKHTVNRLQTAIKKTRAS